VKQRHLAIIGCGDMGSRVGLALAGLGWQISALRRNTSRLPASFVPFSGDYTCAADLRGIAATTPDHVLFTPLPTSRDSGGYELGFAGGVRAMAESGLLARADYSVMVSSTRVYAEVDGGWVDEQSALTTSDTSAQAIIRAEQLFAQASSASTCVRASGVYGVLPGMLLARIKSGLASADSARYSNRIHRDDLAGIIRFLLTKYGSATVLPGCLLASDDNPAMIGEVEAWLAKQLGVELHPSTDVSAGGRGNRRCRNQRVKALGYSLRYPTFQQGYSAILKSEGER